METVILLIHLLIAIALVVTVLLQRSEGGALGIGGGGSFMTGRSSADTLTKITAWLAAAFFVTSITLTILAKKSADPTSVFDKVQTQKQPAKPADNKGTVQLPVSGGGSSGGAGILDKLKPPASPQVPQSQ